MTHHHRVTRHWLITMLMTRQCVVTHQHVMTSTRVDKLMTQHHRATRGRLIITIIQWPLLLSRDAPPVCRLGPERTAEHAKGS